ncbi:MAG: MerR family transcriptional regulator [Gemmatimonadales bacterium]|nr:MerR family transcriptional regulator [Gemmatimonadota bacterium]MCL4215125.1 MerR family transcriptional regulator [Gemmatimonadales bacterium]
MVVRRSGVSADLLRAWEKRYQAVTPSRSDGGHRLYSDADIERLRLIKDAMAGGRRIGDVASLPTEEIARLVSEDAAQQQLVAPAATDNEDAAQLLADAIAAVRRADQGTLRVILSRALFTRTPERFTTDIATPFMYELGELWHRGELTPAHEHAASEVMRRLMHDMLGMLPPPDGAPRLVVATLTGQRHEIGALFAATAAALDGWRVTYLGSDLPGPDIARVALDVGARAVALSITTANPALADELSLLRKRLGTAVPILVGGQQAEAVAGAVRQVDIVPDVDTFRTTLNGLR